MQKIHPFLGAALIGAVAVGTWLFGRTEPAHSETAAASAYHSAQIAAYHHREREAEAGFVRARDLTSDSDRAAWAQYQLACCYLSQPSQQSEAVPALQRLIHDYPHHFLAARAQADLDRLEGKKTPTVTAPAIDTDCGPECLQYLLADCFHRSVSLAALRKLAGTNEHGTTLLGLQRAAQAMGLRAEGMQADQAYFRHIDRPMICWTRRSHYVAVAATPAVLFPPFWAVRLYDPTGRGEKTMTPDEFSQQWDGYVLALSAKKP